MQTLTENILHLKLKQRQYLNYLRSKNRAFKWILKHARDKVRNRENLRFERTRLFGRVRQVMVNLGKHYVQSGAMESKEDIFALPLEKALDYNSVAAQPEEAKKIVQLQKDRHFITPPDRFQSRGKIHPSQWQYDTEKLTILDQLQGTAACPGVITGTVKVFKSPSDGSLKPGEILVAQQTDPGWVVLFPSASAILVERGSLLSHSAIVARELQIPCIVSVPNITSQLQSGDLVQMNGSTGEINILDRANK